MGDFGVITGLRSYRLSRPACWRASVIPLARVVTRGRCGLAVFSGCCTHGLPTADGSWCGVIVAVPSSASVTTVATAGNRALVFRVRTFCTTIFQLSVSVLIAIGVSVVAGCLWMLGAPLGCHISVADNAW